jgi:hypothetical protein
MEMEEYRELAERAVVALHMYERSKGQHNVGFDDCRMNLCADWHRIEAGKKEVHAKSKDEE